MLVLILVLIETKNPSYVMYEGFFVVFAPSPGLEPGTP
jgi:hypothetical protein